MLGSTRDRILEILCNRGEATVAELAEVLQMSGAAVRRHLDGLRADGLVDVRILRHGVGRPSFAFFPTERAEERVPGGYARLLSRMFQRLAELGKDEVAGHDGGQVLTSLFEGIAQDVAREHRDEVMGRALEERVAQTSEALQSEGIIDRWHLAADGYRLMNSACPYRQAARASPAACQSDRLAIELLLGAPVEQVGRLVDGAPCCEYVVRPQRKRSRRGQAVAAVEQET